MTPFYDNVRRIDFDGNIFPDRYVRFRRTFLLDKVPDNVLLRISAESGFAVYLNGKRLEMTQYPDFPDRKTVSEMNVSRYLKPGNNVIGILVFRLGYGCLTNIPSSPGLVVELSSPFWNIAGDSLWKCSLSESFTQGRICKVSSQLGVTFEYDADKEDDWLAENYDDRTWQNAAEYPLPDPSGFWREFVPRPVPFLQEMPPKETLLTAQGELLRHGDDLFRKKSFPWEIFPAITNDEPGLFATPPISLTSGGNGILFAPRKENIDGYYAVIDMGQETIGFLRLELDAPKGTFVKIRHGEHLDDGEVRAYISGRNFCDHYYCKEGSNVFFYPFRRIGARFLQLDIFPPAGAQIRLHYAGLSETLLPLPPVAPFTADDSMELRLRSIAIHTLICCMHDHYEDSPWREQALYAYDSRNEILFGYYLWGNYSFVRTSLDLLSRSCFREESGYLALTAPGVSKLTIPSFTFVWILEMAEYVLYSGDIDFFREKSEKIEWILTHSLERKSTIPGLYVPCEKEDPGIWSFYEWTAIPVNDRKYRTHDALYNLYLLLAFRSAAKGYDFCGETAKASFWNNKAEELGKRIYSVFYDAKRAAWTILTEPEEPLCEHVQILLLAFDLIPEEKKQDLLKRIMEEKEFIPVTFSVLPFLAETLFRYTPETRRYVEHRIRKSFEPLLEKGLTTFPETSFCGDAFRKAGSLCHGWSAVPAWFSQAFRLGVTPSEPGFRKFRVRPWAGKLTHVSGEVVTPHGSIGITWKKTDQGLDLKIRHPAGLECILEPWEEYPFTSVIVTEY